MKIARHDGAVTTSCCDGGNVHLQEFRRVSRTVVHLQQHKGIDISIRILGADKGDAVQYEMPHPEDLAMLIVGDLTLERREILSSVVEAKVFNI